MPNPARTTRSQISPGLVDRPNLRRPSAVVAEEKAKKKKTAALKAEEQRRRVAQVAEVEKEVRKAQEEAKQTGKRGRATKVTKKIFCRPSQDANVSTHHHTSTVFPRSSNLITGNPGQ